MTVDAINTLHVHAAPRCTEQVSRVLAMILDELAGMDDCLDAFITADTYQQNTWVLSSHWNTRAAMERYFHNPALSAWVAMLAQQGACRIQFGSFLSQHAA